MQYNYEELTEHLGIKGNKSGDQIVGLCPLHYEKNPSFSINIRHGAWTCFSQCGAGGFVGLVMKIQGCSVREAHDWMLAYSNTTPVKVNLMPGVVPTTVEPEWLTQWNWIGNDFIPTWFFDRGFDWPDVMTWKIRYDERFFQLVIPYFTADGILRGTVVRNLKSEPKYKNSKDLPRSKYLFGHTQANGPLILITEGPLDTIWLRKHGFYGVALLGTSMTIDHVLAMHGFSEICLALDNDKAGEDAIEKHSLFLMQQGGRPMSQVTRLHLPKGKKDVQDLTADELQQVINERTVV